MQSPFFRQWKYPHGFQQQMRYNQAPNNQNQNRKNIPSNIKFEPFDKKLLEQTKSAIQDKHNQNKISQLIQNEYNGSIFYEKLMQQAQSQIQTQILNKLKENSIQRKNILNEIYKLSAQNIYKPQDTQINNFTGFKTGINFAIHEENMSAQNLLELSNEINEPEMSKKINRLFYQKLLDINYLIWLATNSVDP